MVLVILGGIVLILWVIAFLMDVASAQEEELLPGYLLARHVPTATLAERQQARRERLAACGDPSWRDPIDVELAEMLRAER